MVGNEKSEEGDADDEKLDLIAIKMMKTMKMMDGREWSLFVVRELMTTTK